jgi:hypothetical protein
MARVDGVKFVSDAAKLEEMGERAKLRRCPHCHQLGAMNAHGFLRGYSLLGAADMVRGRRFFCSNRGRRPGCGRTVSVLLQMMIAAFTVTTALLASFVASILAGASVRAAWLMASFGVFSERSGYRLWQRLRRAVGHLRSQLLRRQPPPQSQATEPIGQVMEHIRECAPDNTADLFTVFQRHLQCGIFSR